MLLMTVFGCSALLLACIGIYGVMAYTVEQKKQEIGIRLALGAEAAAVRNMVVREGAGLALSGIAIGLGAAWMLARVLEGLLLGVSARDPIVFRRRSTHPGCGCSLAVLDTGEPCKSRQSGGFPSMRLTAVYPGMAFWDLIRRLSVPITPQIIVSRQTGNWHSQVRTLDGLGTRVATISWFGRNLRRLIKTIGF